MARDQIVRRAAARALTSGRFVGHKGIIHARRGGARRARPESALRLGAVGMSTGGEEALTAAAADTRISLGSARQAWDPVIQDLAERFDVLAVDLPGFGESEPLPADVEPLPAVLAARVAGLLDELGITTPHVAGNSLGGWVALELAGIRPVASLALLSPAGLWRDHAPLYNRVSLRAARWFARHATGPLSRLMTYRLARVLVLGQTHGQPASITPGYARMAIRAIGTCPGFDATMKATEPRCYRAGARLDAPVTVAFGSRDFLLLRHQSRHLTELPPGTHVGSLPGCGHVPMADNPRAVIALVTAATTRRAGERQVP